MLKTDGIKLFTGIVFSNVAGATVPDILDAGAHLCQPQRRARRTSPARNATRTTSSSPGRTTALHESAGQNATNLGYKKAFILAPNYQAGKDALAGFKRFFKGEIVGEVYTRLDQTDFAAEMAQIRAAKPDVVFQFHPGGLGIAFLRQYQQAGLLGNIPMVVAAPSLDATTLKAVGDAAHRHQRHRALEFGLRQSGQQEVHGGLDQEIQPRCRPITPARAMTPRSPSARR